MTRARWAAPPRGTSNGRKRLEGIANATSARSKGTTMSAMAIDVCLFPEMRQPVGVERSELAVDLVNHDSHDEDADQEVEQNSDLDEKWNGLYERQAHDEDAVLQNEIARHLGDGLAPCGEHDESREHRGE